MHLRLALPVFILSGLAIVASIAAFGFGASKANGRPVVGLICTSWVDHEVPIVQRLGNKVCRIEFEIGASATSMDTVIGAYAAAGVQVQPLAGFDLRSRGLPSTAEAQSLRSWAARFGPGGTFWQGKSNPVPIANIEFGNETGYSYQSSDNSTGAYASRAQTYALRAKDASIALSGTGVGLLIQIDDGGGWPWVANMKAAVPDLDRYAAGWTQHPYGTDGIPKVRRGLAEAAAAGWSASIPLYFTEWGLATDNGRTLSDNYGLSRSMSYSDAAATVRDTFTSWQSAFPTLAQILYYRITDLNSSGATSEREDYFGATTYDGADKGALTTELKSWFGGTTPTGNPGPAAQAPAATPAPVATTPKPATPAPAPTTTKAPTKTSPASGAAKDEPTKTPVTPRVAPTTYITEWDGRLFPTAGTLRSYVTARGVNWAAFLDRHPAVAEQAALPFVTWNGKRFYDQASLTSELATQKMSFQAWAKTHPAAAAIVSGDADATTRAVPLRRLASSRALVTWDATHFTTAQGLRSYVAQQKLDWDAFLAKHPALVKKMKLASVSMDGRQFYTRGSVAKWLSAHNDTLASWSANHPGAAEKLMA